MDYASAGMDVMPSFRAHCLRRHMPIRSIIGHLNCTGVVASPQKCAVLKMKSKRVQLELEICPPEFSDTVD